MKRFGLLIALGIFALLAFVLATLPASVAGGQLARMGVQATAFNGSVWSGTATGVAWRGAPLGRIEWHITPSALLRGRIAGHTRLVRDDGTIQTGFSAAWSGKDVVLSGTNVSLPIAALEHFAARHAQGLAGAGVGIVRGNPRRRRLAGRLARHARPRWARRAATAQCTRWQLSRGVSTSAAASLGDHRRRTRSHGDSRQVSRTRTGRFRSTRN